MSMRPDNTIPRLTALRHVGTCATILLLLAVGFGANQMAAKAQPVVESEEPAEGDWKLNDAPRVRIGLLEGAPEYLFGNVTGAVRLADGSIVVADEQSHSLRKFTPDGRHLWSSGHEGKAPGEYEGLRLLRGCPDAELTVFDWNLDRITRIDADGRVSDTHALRSSGIHPYRLACTADGGLVVTPWPDYIAQRDLLNISAGDSYRWTVSLDRLKDGSVVNLRSDIPGAERTVFMHGSRPRVWGRNLVFATTAAGVWLGSANDYELEHIDFAGRLIRRVRWHGPDLTVTRAHIQRYRQSRLDRYTSPVERRRFEERIWPDILKHLPAQFPAYDAILPLEDGRLWITTHSWRAPQREVHLLDANGAWLRRLLIPADARLYDAGPDWVLVHERGELGEPTIALYDLTRSASSPRN